MKGVAGIIIVFALLFLIAILIFSVISPFLLNITTAFLQAGDTILEATPQTNITEVQEIINNSRAGLIESQTILSYFVQYAWLWIILIVVIAIFIWIRQQTEYTQRVV